MRDQFSAAVEKIYAAASGEEPWAEALHSIEDLTGSAGAVLGFVPADELHLPFNIAGRFTSEQCATYSQLYQPICRRTRYMMDHPNETAVYDALLITEQEMNTDPVYNWFAQHDLRYFVGAALPPTRSHSVVFTLQRSPKQGHVQRADVELFREVKAHLGRALTLADQLGSLRSFERFGKSIFEALPQALVALDRRGQLVFANDAAAQLMRRRDGLSLSNGRLHACSPEEQSHLERLISNASEATAAAASGWTRISRPNGMQPYAVFVAPLRTTDDELIAEAAHTLVIVHDPCARASAEPGMLAAVYGLTDAESRLASALLAGHSLESAAALLHIQVATARSHLKSIFAKLRVNRQQDLVRVLSSVSSIHF